MRCWRRVDGRLIVDDRSDVLVLDGNTVVGELVRAELAFGSLTPLPDDSLTLTQRAAVVRWAPLRRLVERAYEAFADCPHPRELVGCPCCVPADAGAALLRTPLRELSYDRLERYLWKAVTTWGSGQDFRWFAPRVLEIALVEQPPLLDLDVTLGKFVQAGWESWPAAERSAVDHLVYGYWDNYLDVHPQPRPVGETLTALGKLADRGSLLTRWTPLATDAAALHLRDLLGDLLGVGVHLAPDADPADPVDGWLHTAELRAAVDDAFFRTTDPATGEALSLISDYLR